MIATRPHRGGGLRLAAACLLLLGASAAARAHPVVDAARSQIGRTTVYDPAYRRMAFPGGDVPEDRGVCTDVVVRALRAAYRYDLQQRVNADMRLRPGAYPRRWGLKGADSNIDHRRVPNLQAFFRRSGWERPAGAAGAEYRAGDLVTQMLPGNLPHIVVVSDRSAADGRPLVIHNIGQGTREEDTLRAFPITGHYRLPPMP